MQLTAKHQEYWRKNLRITSILLFVWFFVSFVLVYFSRELSSVSFFGFPFSFYMAAQGSLIIYVLIIWYYAHYMNKLDIEHNVHEGEDE